MPGNRLWLRGRGENYQSVILRPISIHALDIDVDMLRTADKEEKKMAKLPLHLLAADAQELPFPGSLF